MHDEAAARTAVLTRRHVFLSICSPSEDLIRQVPAVTDGAKL